jgi:bacillithiol biosynthesis cysteine-adding enzyme BshC
MNLFASRLSYAHTGFFSKIVTDYLLDDEKIKPFRAHPVSLEGIKASLKNRQQFSINRSLLVQELNQQYATVETTELVRQNIQKLLSPNCFTITTAHQPNLFTGPLYFLYKILHAAQLATYLKKELPDYDFVPVYYMGSEDADLEELNHLTIQGNKLVWSTRQTGAVGRMRVDEDLLKLLTAIKGQLAVLPYGKELVQLLQDCFTKGKSISQATFELVNKLTGAFGVVVLIPDNKNLKTAFAEVVKKELLEQFSNRLVEETTNQLSEHYKVRASGRPINLFYLIDDKRERIEKEGDNYVVRTLHLSFSREEILMELQMHPERFSANVILRGVFQESILPNIAFIGGGGELAYWLELKQVFEAVKVPYPVIVLRNSFLWVKADQMKKASRMGLSIADLFLSEQELMHRLVLQSSQNDLTLTKEIEELKKIYEQIKQKTSPVDETLLVHIEVLFAQAEKKLHGLEKKLFRAEKRKYETEQRQIQTLKTALFPQGSLQERVENFSYYYALYGKKWLQAIYDHSPALEQEFVVLSEAW